MKYEVKTKNFSGPLEKLLQLIEARELEITNISLSDVTADFLEYVKSLQEAQVEPRIIADFLVVAARLILIKSKVLLPSLELTDDEEEDIHDLEHRLKLYKEFSARGKSATGGKNASEHITDRWSSKNRIFTRALFLHLGSTSIFYPPPDLSVAHLHDSIAKLFSALQEFVPETQKIESTIITIEEKIEELLNRFNEAASHSFKDMTQLKSKSEMIVIFLAMLQLVRTRVIDLEQSDLFGDIIISKLDA